MNINFDEQMISLRHPNVQEIFSGPISPDNSPVTDTDTTSTAQQKDKARPPRFLISLSEDLRRNLERAAFVNERTLTAEITHRLRTSLDQEPTRAPAPHGGYAPSNGPNVHHTNEKGPASALSDTDRAMLEVFRKLPPKRQLALLSLFE